MTLQLNNLLKALEPYSGAFLISVIWGEISKAEMPKYRLKIMRRLKSGNFTKLELEKLNEFLKQQSEVIDEYLRCV